MRQLLSVLLLGSLLIPSAWPQEEAPPETEVAPDGVQEPAADGAAAEAYVEPEPEPEPQPEPEPAPAPRTPPPVRQIPSRTGLRPGVAPPRRGFQPPAPPVQPSPRADDPLPKTGGTPDEAIAFDFVEDPLSKVIEAIARMTGKNFEYDPQQMGATVTLITHDKIPPELAYEVLESILYSRGFTMVETLDGHLIKIVQSSQTPTSLGEKIGLKKGTGGIPESYDTMSTHVVAIKHASAETIATLLQGLGSAVATVVAYPPTNTLIVTDTADGLRRMFALLEEIDVAGYDTETEIFMIEYSRAEVLAQQLNEVLMGTGAAPARAGAPPPTPARPMPPQRLPTSRALPGQAQSSVVGSREEVLRIVPDERLNALIVIATPSLMERSRELIAKLDTPTPYEANNMNVYKLLNADAEKVEEALNAFLGATPRTATDRPAAQTGEIQPFEKKVVVARYEQTNALLILASPQDYKVIREIIAQLDVPQRQVMVEAVIMDVSIQDTFGLTVDVASVTGNDAFAMGNTSNISSLFNATQLATELSTGTAALGTALRLLNLGNTGGLTAGVFDTIEATVDGQKIKIPFVPFLIKALQTVTDVDILSQPSLTTQDKEPADIVVGQELPVPTVRSGYTYDPRQGGDQQQQQQYPAYGLTSYGRGISREEIGVKMKITPQINEGDYVSIETEIEVSEPTTSTVGIDPNELGPTFNKSRITNNVVVRDGTTGIIGGLIKETVGHNRSQSPILGDLPVLGWLFRNKSNTRRKQNVVVLITPYIIKDGTDLERITKHKMEEFKAANVDVLFEQGIIRKIRKGGHMRNRYRPSADRTDSMLERGGFGRGDIPR